MHFTEAGGAHDDRWRQHRLRHQERYHRSNLRFIGFNQNAQHGGFFGIGDEFGGIVGRNPATLGQQLMHAIGGPLGLQNADIERQIGTRQKPLDDVARLAETPIECVIFFGVEPHRRIVEQRHRHFNISRFQDESPGFRRKIGAQRHAPLPGRIAHPQHRQHVPVIERRCRRQKRQGDLVLVGDDGEHHIGIEVAHWRQGNCQSLAHIGHRIDGKLQNGRHHLVALAAGRRVVCQERRQLHRQRDALFDRAGLDDREEDIDVETETGFVFHAKHRTRLTMPQTCQLTFNNWFTMPARNLLRR